MDQGIRIAAAVSVLAGGLLVALLFRHQSGREDPSGPATSDQLVLRRRVEPQQPAEPAAGALPAVSGRVPTVVRPAAPVEPPDLARDYPGVAAPVAAKWSPSVGDCPDFRAATRSVGPKMGLSPSLDPDKIGPEEAAVRTHRIVDGDTLRALAERYLGSADRAWEIYQTNRDVLPSPEVLPIGMQLKLPPRDRAVASPSNYMPKRPLVPLVPTGAGT